MSNPTIDSAKLVGQIGGFLKALPESLGIGKSDEVWTTEIKRGISKLGHENGFLVCYSGFPTPKDQEWLYDLTWFRNTPEHYLEELIMVLESEWCRDADGIHYDFEKLLVAKAPIKVMIFQNHKDNLDALWAMLAEGILRYRNHDLGETFVLAAFQNETQKFVIKHGNHVEIFRA